MMKRFLVPVFCLAMVVHPVFAQQDTVRSYELPAVEVRSSSGQSSFRTVAPVQMVSIDGLTGALQVSDAVKHFAGVQVKDYGGVGGLKTVSIRSLGANYTAVAYDGVAVSDYQTGQVDLGRFSLDNVADVRLATGPADDLFQPARNVALGGLIRIETLTFVPSEERREEWKAGVRTGSWQLWNPSLTYSRGLGKRWVGNVSGEYLRSKGDYPFRMDGEMRRRRHSEVENWKGEVNVSGRLGLGGRLAVKAYGYDSDRNIPGAVVSYTTYAGERMRDRTAFVQAVYRQVLGDRWWLLSNAKYGWGATRYDHALYPDRASRYDQREAYGNVTLLYRWSERGSVAWANDGSWGGFRAFHANKSYAPSRVVVLSALSGKYEAERWTLYASGLFQATEDGPAGSVGSARGVHGSPSVGGSVQPVGRWPFRLRAGYRNTYRLPTFADIYYPSLPNEGLKPENAHQYNVGVVAVAAAGRMLPVVSVSVDAYYNRVENKIMAIPMSSMALWSVRNYGSVRVRGLDVNGRAEMGIAPGFSASVSGNYTCQEVLNERGQVLRYTPRDFASVLVGLKTRWCDWGYSLVYCGRRYYNETPSAQSVVEGYVDQGFSVNKRIGWGDVVVHLSAECLNFTDRQYEVVHAYPMPGRWFQFGLKIIY
jgi:outer membrane cobalamin receptor